MSDPYVRYRLLPDDVRGGLVPGDIIGRSPRAELHLEQPQVSEFHAALSLRAGRLRLLALRGELVVDGRRVLDAPLEAGVTVHLTPSLSLLVEEVGRLDEELLDGDVGPTRRDGTFFPPMRLTCSYTTVRVDVRGRPAVMLGGNYARIISELAEFAAPVPWRVLAEQIWKPPRDMVAEGRWLRDRYDRTLAKLRHKLLRSGLPTGLIAVVDGEVTLVTRDVDEVVVE